MNRYQAMMEQIAPPAGQAARLRARVLAAAPAKRRAYRPRSLVRKALLAAAVAAVLAASVGVAAELTTWDGVLAGRFAPGTAGSPAAETVFQEVNATAVCGDVTLTVRQAVGDAQTLYLLVDYQLPETVDVDAVQAMWDAEEGPLCPTVELYADSDADWEDLRGLDERQARAVLGGEHNVRGSGSTETVAFDRESRTLTYLLSYQLLEPARQKSLTLTATPPRLRVGEVWQPLAEDVALATFQPTYTTRTKTGRATADGVRYTVKLTPLALQIETKSGEPLPNGYALRRRTVLVLRDGTERTAVSLSLGNFAGGGTGYSSGTFGETYRSSCTVSFREIQDLSQVKSVRVGEVKVSLW